MTKLIIFDCDGVLVADFDRKRYNNVFMKNFLKKHGPFGCESLDEALKRQNKLWFSVEDKVMTGKMSQKAANEFWLGRMGMDKGLVGEFIKGDMDFWRKSVKSRPTKQIKKTLGRLRSMGYKLAVLSNDIRRNAVKKEILSWAGLDECVDAVYTAHSIGHRKPEKESYLHIVKVLNSVPANTIFVGHQDYEIEGANNAGLRTVCVRQEPYPIADFHIRRLSSLPRILQ